MTGYFACLICACMAGAPHGASSDDLTSEPTDIRSLILSIDTLPVPKPSNSEGESATEFKTVNNVASVETRTRRKQTAVFQSLVAFDPNADSLWPGSTIQGRSIASGILDPIPLRRQSGTITITNLTRSRLSGESDEVSLDIEDPTLASVQAAINKLVTTNVTPDSPAKVSFHSYRCYSLDHAMFQIGMAASWLGRGASAALEQDFEKHQNHCIVDFTQSYYTVSFAPKDSPEGYFDPKVPMDKAMLYIKKDNPPAYVSSVTYGRRLVLLFSSEATTSELKVAVDAAYNGLFASGEVNVNAKTKEILQSSDISVLAIGGPASGTVELLAGEDKVQAMKNYVEAGINFGPQSPGVPISYELRYMKDLSPARLSLTTDYELRDYRPQKIASVTVTVDVTSDDKDENEPVTFTFKHRQETVEWGTLDKKEAGKWDKSTSHAFKLELPEPIPLSEKGNIVVHFFKFPEGSDTGCGMGAVIWAKCTLEDGKTDVPLFRRNDQLYGDGNPYDLDLN